MSTYFEKSHGGVHPYGPPECKKTVLFLTTSLSVLGLLKICLRPNGMENGDEQMASGTIPATPSSGVKFQHSHLKFNSD